MSKLEGKVVNDGFELSQRTREWGARNVGARFEIVPLVPESSNMRRWFEGAVIPLITFYQEGMDYKDSGDRTKVRDWLMQEFNGEMVTVAGNSKKVAASSKGKLKELSEKVIDWMSDQGYQTELLVPDLYKKWVDEVYSYGGADYFIDYLLEIKSLRKVK